jgi:hypothetical protein
MLTWFECFKLDDWPFALVLRLVAYAIQPNDQRPFSQPGRSSSICLKYTAVSSGRHVQETIFELSSLSFQIL